MTKDTRNVEIDELNSLIGLMIAGGEIGSADENRIEETRRLLDKWHRKGHKLFTGQQVIKKRDKITLDAKEVSFGSEKMWIWVAVDLNDEMVIAIHVSYLKNMAATYSFLKNIAKLCKGTLPRVFVNGETWDPSAFEKLGFRYFPVDFGQGSVAETFLSIVDCRICKFLERFSDEKTPKKIRWWIEGFAGFTNYWTAKR